MCMCDDFHRHYYQYVLYDARHSRSVVFLKEGSGSILPESYAKALSCRGCSLVRLKTSLSSAFAAVKRLPLPINIVPPSALLVIHSHSGKSETPKRDGKCFFYSVWPTSLNCRLRLTLIPSNIKTLPNLTMKLLYEGAFCYIKDRPK